MQVQLYIQYCTVRLTLTSTFKNGGGVLSFDFMISTDIFNIFSVETELDSSSVDSVDHQQRFTISWNRPTFLPTAIRPLNNHNSNNSNATSNSNASNNGNASNNSKNSNSNSNSSNNCNNNNSNNTNNESGIGGSNGNSNIVGVLKKTTNSSKSNSQSGFRSLLRKAPRTGSLHHIGGSGSDSSSSSRAGYRSRLGSSEEVRDESEMVVTSYTKPEKQRHHHHHHHRHKHSSSSRPKEEKFSRH